MTYYLSDQDLLINLHNRVLNPAVSHNKATWESTVAADLGGAVGAPPRKYSDLQFYIIFQKVVAFGFGDLRTP